MFNTSEIVAAFAGLVGFNQNADPGGVQIKDANLLASSSGLRFNVQHPLMSLNALAGLAPAFDTFKYPNWAAGNFAAGVIVEHSGQRWISTEATTAEPAEGSAGWKVFDGFTEWLRERVEQGTIQVINDWLTMKEMNRTAKNLLARSVLFPQNLLTQADANRGKIVGRAFVLPQSESLVADLIAVGVRMEGAETFTLKLWRSDRPSAPVMTQEVTTTVDDAKGTKWVPLNWELKAGPTWYVSYDQGELVGRSLSTSTLRHHPAGRFLRVFGFEGGLPAGDDPDAVAVTTVGYGLNFRAAVRCDYTDFIIEQRALFADAIAKGVAVKLLTEFVWNASSRTNATVAGVDRAQVNYDIHGEAQGRASGLRHEYNRALSRITFDKSAIDPVCLPCRSNGITYGTT